MIAVWMNSNYKAISNQLGIFLPSCSSQIVILPINCPIRTDGAARPALLTLCHDLQHGEALAYGASRTLVRFVNESTIRAALALNDLL
jgi:hypothetical protein